MAKIIAAINMTIDGFCDHTGMTPDEEIHDHYRHLLDGADAILYGRKTYQLMRYWQELLANPSGEQSMDDFASSIDRIPKIVFSHTLPATDWNSAKLATKPLDETIAGLKEQSHHQILVGSRSLIAALTNLNLIDEYQLCVHPVIASKGLPLFDQINDRTFFKLVKTKTFGSGAIILYYIRQ